MLAGGFFGMMFLQKHLDKRAYEKTDTKLESFMDAIAKAMTLTLLLLICLQIIWAQMRLLYLEIQ